jgi:hypothetical protein
MPHTDISENPVVNVSLTILASITGLFGATELADIDMILAIILKSVSILAFTALVIINWNKVWRILIGKDKKKDGKS